MKSINYVIVEVDDLYNNIEEGIVINDSIESVENINRTAKVISAPDFTILESGDEIIIHHNIFRKKYTVKGRQINSNFWIEGNRYFVPLTEIFMYKRDSEWVCVNPYCFIKPIDVEENILGFNVLENIHKGRLNHEGVVLYSNPDLEKQGIIEGTKILFSKNSEYEFKIDGQLCYKMTTNDILGIVEWKD